MPVFQGRGRSLDLIALLPVLKTHGLGRATTSLMEQKAIAAASVGSDRIGSGNVGHYFDAMWVEHCPTGVKAALLDFYGPCAKCDNPRFDGYVGESGAEYCSDNCAYEAHDEDPDDWEDEYYEDADPEPQEEEFELTPDERQHLDQLGDDLPGMETEPGWGA